MIICLKGQWKMLKNKKYLSLVVILLLCLNLFLTGCSLEEQGDLKDNDIGASVEEAEEVTEPEIVEEIVGPRVSSSKISIKKIPKYKGKTYIAINGNKPSFDKDEMTSKSFEFYSPLDKLGRCGVAMASVGEDIMPTEERGAIGQVKPTGWETKRYDFVDGKYVYNRCHLLGYQLTGENANVRNLITGTRTLNNRGMLPFENRIADYVDRTGNNVLYRVTPIFTGDNLVARGVQMEAKSVEDKGKGLMFNVFVYNVEPNVKIDYKTGKTQARGQAVKEEVAKLKGDKFTLNINTKKIHYNSCPSAKATKEKNKKKFKGSYDYLIRKGYEPCQRCLDAS